MLEALSFGQTAEVLYSTFLTAEDHGGRIEECVKVKRNVTQCSYEAKLVKLVTANKLQKKLCGFAFL